MSEFPRPAHVVITVSDLSVTVPFYEKLFGMKPAIFEDFGNFSHTVFVFPDGFIFSIHKFNDELAQPGPASEFRQGLDHFAWLVPSRAALEEWADKLDAMGIEHGKILDASYGSGLAFRDPDNIQLEFFAAPE
jgi:glyoxylase I family protein